MSCVIYALVHMNIVCNADSVNVFNFTPLASLKLQLKGHPSHSDKTNRC